MSRLVACSMLPLIKDCSGATVRVLLSLYLEVRNAEVLVVPVDSRY